MDRERRHSRNRSNTRDDRRYQRQIHHPDNRRNQADNAAAVPLPPGNRRSSKESGISDSNRGSDVRFNTGAGRTNPRDRSAHSAPLPADDTSDDDDDDDDHDANVAVQPFPTTTRLRTSDVVDPYLGDSLSSVTPTPYSLSGRNRENVIRRSSSTPTFSEEELNIKYRKVEGTSSPSREVTDNHDVVQAASTHTETSYPTTHKSRSEYPPRRPLAIGDVRRPYSETGTRQYESRRTHQRSRFMANEDIVDSDARRYNYRPTKATQTEAALEEGLRPLKGRTSRDERDRGTPKKYDARASYERPEAEESYGELPSRPFSNADDRSYAGRHQAFSVRRLSSQEGVHDAPVVPEATDHTGLPRVLRSIGDVPDLVLDGEEEQHATVNYETNTMSPRARRTPYAGSTRTLDSSPPPLDVCRLPHVETGLGSKQDVLRTNGRGRVFAAHSLPASETSTGVSSQMNQPGRPSIRSVSTSRTLSPSPESSLKSEGAPRVSKIESMGRQATRERPASPKTIALPPEESSSFTGRTEDLATVTIAESSDVDAADGTSSVPAARRSHNKAVQVSIAQPDKMLIACTVLSGVLTIVLVAVILFAVLSR